MRRGRKGADSQTTKEELPVLDPDTAAGSDAVPLPARILKAQYLSSRDPLPGGEKEQADGDSSSSSDEGDVEIAGIRRVDESETGYEEEAKRSDTEPVDREAKPTNETKDQQTHKAKDEEEDEQEKTNGEKQKKADKAKKDKKPKKDKKKGKKGSEGENMPTTTTTTLTGSPSQPWLTTNGDKEQQKQGSLKKTKRKPNELSTKQAAASAE